jgi:DNA-binding beta-propeller fold protein YncE
LWLAGHASAQTPARTAIELPTSKRLLPPMPGDPHVAGGFPTTIAIDPSGRYAALLDGGYGMIEAGQRQGIVIVDLQSHRVTHFADPRLGPRAQQTYFLGLAWNPRGDHLFASVASITDPVGKARGNTGNGIAVYTFTNGSVKPERFIPIPPAMVPAGKTAAAVSMNVPLGYAVPYPAGLSVFDTPGGGRILVADDLSDDVALIDAASGAVLKRFDLSTGTDIPSAFPYAVLVSRDHTRAWCSLWNGSQVAELNLDAGTVTRTIALSKPESATAAGSHPTAMLLSPDESTLFVALANADQVAVIDARTGGVRGYLSTLLPGQRYGGTYPTALAIDTAGTRLAVAASSLNAALVFDLGALASQAPDAIAPIVFIPSEWYPTALAMSGGELLVVTGKGPGTKRNAYQKEQPSPFIAALLHGSIARVNLAAAEAQRAKLITEVMQSNRMNEPATQLFSGRANPIRHVIYIIKENRTYDQILGDLGVGDGDASLTMYGQDITPNQHALARRFGVLDNFYDSGEVSGDGHVWSTAAITSDYTEKTWQIGYRGKEHTYDYEGEVAREFPMLQGQPDVDEPATGYLWANAAKHGVSYRHYGEFVLTFWCDARKLPRYLAHHAEKLARQCAHPTIHPGDALPARLGQPPGSKSPWPWQIPLPVMNLPTKPELRHHFDRRFPGFQVDYPDQLRADEFLTEFAEFVRSRDKGRDDMPQLIVLQLPNDHTGGTRPGMARPAASVADNDLALGRVVEAVSHSAYWDDTAIIALEDDAQNGADHVDAHRSTAYLISKYAPHGAQPFVEHTFFTTVSALRTIEALLGLPPMNNNDAYAPIMTSLFSGAGDQPAFDADYKNRDNGLLYQTNDNAAPGAEASMSLDLSQPDAADSQILNRILWEESKGKRPMPAPRHRAPVPRQPSGPGDESPSTQ